MSLTLLYPSTPFFRVICSFPAVFRFFSFLWFSASFFFSRHSAFVEICPRAAFSNPELEELAHKGFFLSKTKKVLPSEEWSSEAS